MSLSQDTMTCISISFLFGRRRWDSQSGKTKFPETGQVILPGKGRLSKTNIPFYLKLMKVFRDMPRNPGVCWLSLQLQLGDIMYPLNNVLGVNRGLQDFSMRTLSFSIFVRAGFSLRSCIKHRNSPSTGFLGELIILERLKGGLLGKLQYSEEGPFPSQVQQVS